MRLLTTAVFAFAPPMEPPAVKALTPLDLS